MLTKKQYLLLTFIFLIVEIIIALFFHDRFIRPIFGDYLIVFLVYCGLKSLVNLKPVTAVIATVSFAYLVEYLQYIHITDILHMQQNRATRMILGSSFEWIDMLAYTLGGLTFYYLEYYIFSKSKKM